MPDVKQTLDGGATIFNPTPVEILKNNRNKQLRREHEQLLKDVAELKKNVQVTNAAKNKSIRRSRGGY